LQELAEDTSCSCTRAIGVSFAGCTQRCPRVQRVGHRTRRTITHSGLLLQQCKLAKTQHQLVLIKHSQQCTITTYKASPCNTCRTRNHFTQHISTDT
jgi:hypothetical protein